MLVALGLYLALSLLLLGGITTWVLQLRFAERDARLSQLQQELDTRTAEHGHERRELESTIAGLRHELRGDRDRLAGMAEENAALSAAGRRQAAALAALTDEAELARQRASLLDLDARETALWLETAQRERMALERERAALQAQLDTLAMERDTARRQEAGLRGRYGELERRLASLSGEYALAASRMQDRIRDKLDAIERVVSRTGIDPQALLARANGAAGDGQGGPLVDLDELQPSSGGDHAIPGLDAAPGSQAARAPATSFAATLDRELGDELLRLDAVPRLLESLPLDAPLADYRLTSPFGVRTDPITGRRARHGGLDFGAAANSAVGATAPGRVIAAGWRGAYGNLVEIDHGLGFTTRYAHLSRTLARVGEHVAPGDPIGIIGSTGRSTGRHLHYEIRLDGQPLDPAGFLEAGRDLPGILGG
ncbi:MAG: peptidoglycan DD-metalloendopeptidase family protein [Geminicoccaceae bacterium]